MAGNDLMTRAAVAEAWGCSPKNVDAAHRRGLLPRAGRGKYRRSDVDAARASMNPRPEHSVAMQAHWANVRDEFGSDAIEDPNLQLRNLAETRMSTFPVCRRQNAPMMRKVTAQIATCARVGSSIAIGQPLRER